MNREKRVLKYLNATDGNMKEALDQKVPEDYPFALPPVQITKSHRLKILSEERRVFNFDDFMTRQMRGRQYADSLRAVKKSTEKKLDEGGNTTKYSLMFDPSLGIPE